MQTEDPFCSKMSFLNNTIGLYQSLKMFYLKTYSSTNHTFETSLKTHFLFSRSEFLSGFSIKHTF